MVLCVGLMQMFFVCAAFATPATMNFNNALQQQNLHTVLLSIEERLRNLDEIYSMQFSPTVESKIELYAKKLESLDSKIQRMEAITSLNLDKISENISTKNFKDDIFKTNALRKLDSTYEGITHRMGYIERKLDTHVNKLYNKMDSILSKLDKMEEMAAARNSDLEVEMADTIAAVDDIKTTCTTLQEDIFNTSQKYVEELTKTNDLIVKRFLDTQKIIQNSYANITRNALQHYQKETVHPVQNFSEKMNEYENKVDEMYVEVLNNNKQMENLMEIMLKDINSTKIENQKNLRNLVVQIGKLQTRDMLPNESESQKLIEISKKIDINFEKMFLSQDLFLESCHRVQLDESQIESKISVILEKLMDTFEKKISNEVSDTKKYENLLKIHDSNIKSNLYQVGSNINRLYKKINNDNEKFEEKADTLGNALYVLIEDKIDTNESNSQILSALKELSKQIEGLNVEIDQAKNQNKHLTHNGILQTKTEFTENPLLAKQNVTNVDILRSSMLINGTDDNGSVFNNADDFLNLTNKLNKSLIFDTNVTVLTNQTDDDGLFDPWLVDFSTRVEYENFQDDEHISDSIEFTTEKTVNEEESEY